MSSTRVAPAPANPWDEYAISYDKILPLMPYYQEVIERHRRALVEAPAGPVADLGAGTGVLAELVIAAGRSLTAVDSSPAMLAQLRAKPRLAAAEGAELTIVTGTAESLPMLADRQFAAVSMQLALFDMAEPARAISTALRLARPGGRVIITDLKRCFDLPIILDACERRLAELGRSVELADDLARVMQSNHALAPGSRTPFRVEDVFDAFIARGCRDVSITDSHFGQCATVSGFCPL